MDTLLHSATRIDGRGEQRDAWILFRDATIAATGVGSDRPSVDEEVDLAGAIVTPGFLDLHGHGGGGHSFDGDADDIRAALAVHRAHGTTRSVVSLVTRSIDDLCASLATVAAIAAADPLVLGSHLEGPFLAEERRGAHNPRLLRAPAAADVRTLLDAAQGTLRQITIAPELEGGIAAIEAVVAAGAVAAVGHTAADTATARRAFDAGATLVTHGFNAMPPLLHRAPGPIGVALDDDRVTVELILDGDHVHPIVAALAFRAAPGRIALVTDAISAAGSGDGHYEVGGLDVDVADGVALLSGTDTRAGSTLTMDAAVRTAIRLGVAPAAAVAAATSVPAAALGLGSRLGLLAAGYAADAVVLDADWTVRGVWADGVPLPPTGA